MCISIISLFNYSDMKSRPPLDRSLERNPPARLVIGYYNQIPGRCTITPEHLAAPTPPHPHGSAGAQVRLTRANEHVCAASVPVQHSHLGRGYPQGHRHGDVTASVFGAGACGGACVCRGVLLGCVCVYGEGGGSRAQP